MKIVIYSIALLLSVLLQLTIANWVALWGITPDFTILALCFAALVMPRNVVTIMGFATGFLRDGLGYSAPGIGALLFTIIGYIAGTLLFKRSLQKRYEVVLFFSILVFVYFALYHVLVNALAPGFAMQIITDLLPRFVYTQAVLFALLLVLPVQTWRVLK